MSNGFTPHRPPPPPPPRGAPPPHTIAPVAPITPVAAPAIPHFCSRCGTPWHPLWVECPTCAQDRNRDAQRDANAGGRGSVISSLALYFAFLATSLVGIIIGQSGSVRNVANLELTIVTIDSLIVLAWCIPSRKDVLPALQNPAGVRWYALAAGLAVCTFTVASLATGLLNWVFHVGHVRYAQPFLHVGYGWAIVVMTVCLQPAVIEELAFRGIILPGLRQALQEREAILVSAGLFMIIHLSVPSFPHLFLIGVALGFLRARSGSLYPGMLMHFIHNGLCLLWEACFR